MLNQLFIFNLLNHFLNDKFRSKWSYLYGLWTAVLLHVYYKIIYFIKIHDSYLYSIRFIIITLIIISQIFKTDHYVFERVFIFP
jgi:hypothetical protein